MQAAVSVNGVLYLNLTLIRVAPANAFVGVLINPLMVSPLALPMDVNSFVSNTPF